MAPFGKYWNLGEKHENSQTLPVCGHVKGHVWGPKEKNNIKIQFPKSGRCEVVVTCPCRSSAFFGRTLFFPQTTSHIPISGLPKRKCIHLPLKQDPFAVSYRTRIMFCGQKKDSTIHLVFRDLVTLGPSSLYFSPQRRWCKKCVAFPWPAHSW